MSHDYWAEQKSMPTDSDWVKRDAFTLEVRCGGAGKDEAKKKAQSLRLASRPHAGEFSECSPGDLTPPLPFALSISLEWTLTSPFFSRSESQFDVFDNPLCRDRLTGRPVLRASGAKGMLRHAGEMLGSIDAALWTRIMGRANEADTGGEAGRLVTGDVSFDGTPKGDVFSPHDREWGVVRHPVFFEVVPAGTKAKWGLMLFQYNPGEYDMAEAACAVLEAVEFLIAELGMSAKRTVGYGMGEGIKVSLQPGSAVALPLEDRKSDIINPWRGKLPEPPDSGGAEAPRRGEVFLREDGALCDENQALEFKARFLCRENKQMGEKAYQMQLKKLSAKNVKKEWQEMKAYMDMQHDDVRLEREQRVAAYEAAIKEKEAHESCPENVRHSWPYDSVEKAKQSIKRMSGESVR